MSTASQAEVLVTGLNIVDVLLRMPEKAMAGEKHEVRDILIQGGAPAGNAASLLASLGWRTAFIARMGNDTLSLIARNELTCHGVLENHFIADTDSRPGLAVVKIDTQTGDRTVFYTLKGYRSLKAADIPVEDVKQAKLILIDGYEIDAALAMLRAAHGTDCRSVLDIETGDSPFLRQLIELGTDIILPLQAALRLSGESDVVTALKTLSGWTPGQVLITDGVNGSWAFTPMGILHQPSFRVDVVDTTGCGDAYHAAYASALLEGLPLAPRMEFAAWVASQVALKLGGRSNLPTRASIRHADLSALSPELRNHLHKDFHETP